MGGADSNCGLTPDPLAGDITNLQSLNRYAYGLNNPLSFVDRNGAWPTRIHNAILNAAFGGVLSNAQIQVLQAVSRSQDAFLSGGQDPVNSFKHGMCFSGQDLGACSGMIANFIYSNIDLARASGLGATVGLTALGEALHTLSDLTTPTHTGPDGTPKDWAGVGLDTVGHWLGEQPTAANLPLIGRAIRNEVAGWWLTAQDPQKTSGFSSPSAMAQAGIEKYVQAWVFQNLGPFPDPIAEGAARLCGLGNPAACGFGGFGGGGGSWVGLQQMSELMAF